MNWQTRFSVLVSFLVLVPSVLGQSVVYEQSPIAIGNPNVEAVGAASVLPLDTSGQEAVSRAYDNFTLTEEFSISGLQWVGSFNGEFNLNPDFRGIVDFRVEFFQDASNSPDIANSIVSFELDGGLAGINDGTDITQAIVPGQMSSGAGGGSETPGIIETYSTDLDAFTLQPGTYWLAIQARQSFPSPFPPQNPSDPDRHFDPSWSWVLSDDADGDDRLFSFDTFFGDRFEPGIPFNRDLAFSLVGEPTAVEPTTPSGDFNEDGLLDATDIDLLTSGIRTCRRNCEFFDLNQDGVASDADLAFWITSLKETLPGDATLDGTVQFVDFLALSRTFGGEGGWAEGNFNTDTVVDFADFLVLSRNFGLSAGDPGVDVGQGAASAVPEPSTWSLSGLAVLTGLCFRRRRA